MEANVCSHQLPLEVLGLAHLLFNYLLAQARFPPLFPTSMHNLLRLLTSSFISSRRFSPRCPTQSQTSIGDVSSAPSLITFVLTLLRLGRLQTLFYMRYLYSFPDTSQLVPRGSSTPYTESQAKSVSPRQTTWDQHPPFEIVLSPTSVSCSIELDTILLFIHFLCLSSSFMLIFFAHNKWNYVMK